jgi:type II secretory pathway component PulF
LGDLARVIPACRYQLQAAADHVRKARNYLALTVMLFLPAWILTLWVLVAFVVPRMQAIAAEMIGDQVGSWAVENFELLIPIGCLPVVLLLLAAFAVVAGPRMRLWFLAWLPAGLVDGFLNLLPWNNRRARRDFSLTLSLLLDGGVPEEAAVLHAGAATGSHRFRQLAELAAADLRAGAKLPDALSRVDDARELRWRWRVAAETQLPFEHALEGWHESLNAQAVKAEMSSSNLLTSSLILLNGVIVGLIVIGIFQFFTTIIEETALW